MFMRQQGMNTSNKPPALTLFPISTRGGSYTREQAEKLRADFVNPERVSTDENGVIRWRTNNAIISPALYRDDAFAVCPPAQEAAYNKELDAFLTAYRKADPKPDAEQMAEMRAEFGPGSTVVNIFTGRRTRL